MPDNQIHGARAASEAATVPQSNDLTEDQVKALLNSLPADRTCATTRMYEFGQKLVDESVAWAGRLDSKATTMIGYSGAILALLLHESGDWMKIGLKPVELWLALGAALIALVAAGFAFYALIARSYAWFGDSEWFNEQVTANDEAQKRFYVLLMHKVNTSYDQINRRRGRAIIVAQFALAASVLLVSAVLFMTLGRGVVVSV
jgi:hypothetical protein